MNFWTPLVTQSSNPPLPPPEEQTQKKCKKCNPNNKPKEKKVNNEGNNIPFTDQSLSGRIRSPKHTP
jgi:hypothetical protein